MNKLITSGLTLVGGVVLVWYLAKKLRDASNADTQAVTATTKGAAGDPRTLTTTPIKRDPGYIAGAETSSTISRAPTPQLGSLTFRNVYDKFLPFGDPVSARAAYTTQAPPEAKPTIYIN